MKADRSTIDPEKLPERVAGLAGLAALREAADGAALYLVGGAVRDLLLGDGAIDLDVVAEGDAAEVARRLGGDALSGDRFHTARAVVEGVTIDLASARTETYASPGALPEVKPASLAEDLARRDFTVNAMAFDVSGDPEPAGLIDPHGGLADLKAGLIRVLHPRSFDDDPTRVIRAARYAARFGFAVEAETESLLRRADLSTVSNDRVEAELRRLAAEPEARRGFELLDEWGLHQLPEGAAELIESLSELLETPEWEELADRAAAIRSAASGGGEGERVRQLVAAAPSRPSEGAELAAGIPAIELALARALGAEWLDDYIREWRHVGLDIDGGDLMAAGVPEGPVVGRGLEAARRAKLDGEASGREEELAVALAAARAKP